MKNIRDLEKKYMDLIWKWVSSKEFEKDLKEIENYIKEHHSDLEIRYQIKNKIQLAAERLISFYIHKNMKVLDIYSSPISSDFAFYTNDCLINIDAKTIDLDGNENDDKYIQFGPHQISFLNKPLFAKKIKNENFAGITLLPGLEEIDSYSNLPCLTFFIGITYKDNRQDFNISHLKLSNLPNGIVAKEDFDSDLIYNFKTYRYLKKNAASRFGEEYLPKNKDLPISSSWIPFSLRSNKIDTWLDTSLTNPFTNSFAIWRVIDKRYCICLGGDTGRILPEKIKNRTDSSGNNWIAYRVKNINS